MCNRALIAGGMGAMASGLAIKVPTAPLYIPLWWPFWTKEQVKHLTGDIPSSDQPSRLAKTTQRCSANAARDAARLHFHSSKTSLPRAKPQARHTGRRSSARGPHASPRKRGISRRQKASSYRVQLRGSSRHWSHWSDASAKPVQGRRGQ